MYGCLSLATEVLADASWTAMQTGHSRGTELITMPRHSFGPRPVTLLSPTVRTVYTALVRQLQKSLVPPSRSRDNWLEHHAFGQHGRHSYVVDLDFAACYEFIDHQDLGDELNLRSMAPATVSSLRDVLAQISSRGRGLPQMLQASDRLADTYLAVVDRQLERLGYQVHRYVDDYRVIADSWNEANQIIEDAALVARSLGLTLSSEKTTVRRRETVVESELAAEGFLEPYFDAAGVEEGADGRRDPYSAGNDDEVETAVADVYLDVLADWHERFRASNGKPDLPAGMSANLVAALRGCSSASERIDDELLSDLVFDDPLRLEAVCRYLEDRSVACREGGAVEDDEHWQSLAVLTAMERQSPWAKLWLLNSAGELLGESEVEPSAEVLAWADEQVESPLETVRSEAAWLMAAQGKLDADRVKTLYAGATDVTAPAVAAAVAFQDDIPAGIAKAIRHDSPLNEAASAWAED